MTWATLRVLRTVLWRFHGVVGGGRCFLSYEKIAAAAKCCRDSVCVAIAALEDAGILTWVHRLTKIRRREQDLFGAWGSVCKVIRTSNGYRFLDPLDREPGRRILTRLPVNLSLCEQTAPVPALGNVDLAEGFANCPFLSGSTLRRPAASSARVICGRRTRKSFILALVTVFPPIFRDWSEHLHPTSAVRSDPLRP